MKRIMILILLLAACVVAALSGVGCAGRKPSAWEYDLLRLETGDSPAQAMKEAGSQGWEAFYVRDVQYGGIEIWLKRPK